MQTQEPADVLSIFFSLEDAKEPFEAAQGALFSFGGPGLRGTHFDGLGAAFNRITLDRAGHFIGHRSARGALALQRKCDFAVFELAILNFELAGIVKPEGPGQLVAFDRHDGLCVQFAEGAGHLPGPFASGWAFRKEQCRAGKSEEQITHTEFAMSSKGEEMENCYGISIVTSPLTIV